ncbi:hypothetical protein [Pseudomonas sp. ANT_H12B]|uniref:hypothetical protein n=1 Tax=Pseudomonas sp. ANT_H12B TaxID=2597348 RepID=UPI0015B610DC|nr:hypothetical protein [Pseudomonas sp. ANT_H12B]
MTDPPVTLYRLAKRSPPCPPRIPLYIEAGAKPEIGKFAMAWNDLKGFIEITA